MSHRRAYRIGTASPVPVRQPRMSDETGMLIVRANTIRVPDSLGYQASQRRIFSFTTKTLAYALALAGLAAQLISGGISLTPALLRAVPETVTAAIHITSYGSTLTGTVAPWGYALGMAAMIVGGTVACIVGTEERLVITPALSEIVGPLTDTIPKPQPGEYANYPRPDTM